MTLEADRANAADAAAWIACARAGDLEGAWRCSDRIRARRPRGDDLAVPRHLQRIWNGRPFDGRRTLVRCYHGLGDTIQFIRYVPMLRESAAVVIVWAQPALLPLLASVSGVDRLLPLHDGTPDVQYDVDVEVMELPYAFRSTLATLPAHVPYLAADPIALAAEPRPRIGIAWRGGHWNHERSIPFDRLAPLLALTNVSWHRLQVDPLPWEQHPHLHSHPVGTVHDTARCMRALDLVISIDSMPAHLAGALGVPVWTLLPENADWRWLERRSDSPWYPTMTLFRQRRAGDWSPLIEDVHGRVQSWEVHGRALECVTPRVR